MTERLTAEAQLARVLELLPRAARSGGVSLAELAVEMDVTPAEVLRDLQEVYTRAYYYPAGSEDGIQILIEADQVELWTTGDFRRPPRFRPREALALGLGLRILAAEAPDQTRRDLHALAERLEGGLASDSPGTLLDSIAVNLGESADGLLALLHEAARERKRCGISYLKTGAGEPDRRVVDPYVLLVAKGKWYLVGHCHRSGEVRIFRVDRIAAAEMHPEVFTVPEGFDPDLYIQNGRVFRTNEEVEVPVRYSARIARWIEEQGPVDKQEDGSVIVRHHVADPDWLVRHVLQHGADAEVLGPPEMRREVRRALRRVVEVSE